MVKSLIKHAFRLAGIKISRIDPLEETIPAQYNRSPFLPKIYRGSLDRLMYLRDQVEQVRGVEGDIVECGVSIGHGALLFLLLNEYVGVERTYWGFDSFEGFPAPLEKDENTPIMGKGYWANPPETVMKVLRDGRIPKDLVNRRVQLGRGWFQDTLPKYNGRIALLHLDCDLYDSYKFALETLYEKVSPGGIIMFDEYNDQRWPGATKAIDEFFSDKPEKVQQHQKCSWKYYTVKS